MIEYKPPAAIPRLKVKSVFLAGSIDNGQAENWQLRASEVMTAWDVVLINPRRDDWDSNWEQTIDNPQFREQVEWELDGLELADAILMHFTADSKSPITLLELGLFANSQKLVVSCEKGFWRKGNVEVICERFTIPLFDNLDAAIAKLSELV